MASVTKKAPASIPPQKDACDVVERKNIEDSKTKSDEVLMPVTPTQLGPAPEEPVHGDLLLTSACCITSRCKAGLCRACCCRQCPWNMPKPRSLHVHISHCKCKQVTPVCSRPLLHIRRSVHTPCQSSIHACAGAAAGLAAAQQQLLQEAAKLTLNEQSGITPARLPQPTPANTPVYAPAGAVGKPASGPSNG